jgi:hypothetical protein
MDGKSEESSEPIGNQNLESAFAASDRTDMIHPLAVQHSMPDKSAEIKFQRDQERIRGLSPLQKIRRPEREQRGNVWRNPH